MIKRTTSLSCSLAIFQYKGACLDFYFLLLGKKSLGHILTDMYVMDDKGEKVKTSTESR